ncbi:MAG: ABC transporter substrate-binding protein [Flavobacterium sp.]
MQIPKLFLLSSCLIVCILTLQFCQNKTETLPEHTIFRYNESANIASLDPAFAKAQNHIWACNQLFNGLVQLDDDLRIQPDLAKSWEISADGKTYTFHLKEAVFFHEHPVFGEEKTRKVFASDFVYSLERLRNEKVASPGGWILQQVESITAINATTLQIQLKQPFPAFLGLLSMKYASVVPKEVVENVNYDFRTKPIGTGPFYVKHWEENIKLVLRKNPNYFEKDKNGNSLPYLESVAISFLPDKQAAYLLFLQGKFDFISGLDPSYKDDLLTLDGKLQDKHQNKIKRLNSPYLNTEYLGFRLDGTHPMVKDIRVRKALNYGFNREQLVAYLRNNTGIAANHGFIPKGMPGFTPFKGYDYQPELAKRYWEDFKKEHPNQTISLTLQTNANYADIGEFLQREWKKIGIPVMVEVNPPSMLRQAIATGKVDFFRGSWIADYPDAENYLSLFYSKNFAPNGPNYTHFSNAAFDQGYEASFLQTNDSIRFQTYQKLDQMVMEEAAIIPLFYDQVVRFTQKDVHGLGINALNLLHLKRVQKEKN